MAELETREPPELLLRRLKQLERRMGRPLEAPRWSPRLLDLDLLLWGEQILASPDLELPHPAYHLRRFVLKPLAELAPEIQDPRSGRTVRQLLWALDDPLRVEKLEEIKQGSGPKSGSLPARLDPREVRPL